MTSRSATACIESTTTSSAPVDETASTTSDASVRGEHEQTVRDGPETFGPESNLLSRLLSRDEQDRRAGLSPSSGEPAATSVDFPTPGSPARRVSDPGTNPPPSTRSSSLHPSSSEPPREDRRCSAEPSRPSRPSLPRPSTSRPVKRRSSRCGWEPGACLLGRLRLLDQGVPLAAGWALPGPARSQGSA